MSKQSATTSRQPNPSQAGSPAKAGISDPETPLSSQRLLELYDRVADAPDAVEQLRKFVLDLAVRGKLVEQHEGDEPAEDLLKRIKSAKKQQGQKWAAAPLNHEDEPFTLPPSWRWARVGEICSKTGSGSTPRGGKSAYKSSGVPFLRSQNVHNDRLRLDDVAYIDPQTHEKMSGTRVLPGDLLLNITGGSIGRCARVPNDFGEANVSQHVAIIRPASRGLDRFLHTLIHSPYFQSLIFDEQTGAGRGGLPKYKMDQIPVALPPLAEQERIISRINQLIDLLDRLETTRTQRESTRNRLTTASLARLTAAETTGAGYPTHARFALDNLDKLTRRPGQIKILRQSILNLAVRGKLVEQDPSDEPASVALSRIGAIGSSDGPFPVPESWSWVKVAAVAETRLGKMLDKSKNKGFPRPYLRNINVRWFDFDLSDLLEMQFEDYELDEFSLRAGDVLICEGGEPGRAAVWDERASGIYFQKAIHRVRFLEPVDPNYFLLALKASADDGRLEESFTGTGIKHFTGKGLKNYAFSIPPLPEQRRIVAKVGEIMNMCDELVRILTTSDSKRVSALESLIGQALPGTLRIRKVS